MRRSEGAMIAFLGVLSAVAAVWVPSWLSHRRTGHERAAEAALRKAWVAERTRFERTGRYAADLTALDLPPLAEGYRFGVVGLDEGGRPLDPARRTAYYAVPEAYGDTGVRSLLVDETGSVYALDRRDGSPVTAWPADDPTSAGWILLER